MAPPVDILEQVNAVYLPLTIVRAINVIHYGKAIFILENVSSMNLSSHHIINANLILSN